MSETTPERPGQPGAKKPGKKLFGMDRTTVIVFGVALVGAAAYFLWRKHQSSSSAGTQQASSSSAVDYSGQLSAIQSELESLMAGQSSSAVGTGAASGGGSGGGYGYPYGGSTGPASSTVGTSSSSTPASAGGSSTTPTTTATGTSSSSGSGTTTTAPAKAAASSAKPKPAMPSPKITKVSSTSVGLSWPAVANATSYTTRATYQGALARSYSGPQTAITIYGLTPDHTYTFHVAANGPGGSSAETNGPAQKTSAS